jgi:hypothetical protein
MGYKPIAAGNRPALNNKPRVPEPKTRGGTGGFPWPDQVLSALRAGGQTSASTICKVMISKGLCKKPA